MTATILDGRAVAKELAVELAAECAAISKELGYTPLVTTVLVGDDPASRTYVASIERTCTRVGLGFHLLHLPFTINDNRLRREIIALNRRPEVTGIIVQMPLPDHLSAQVVAQTITPDKDIDGITPTNAGRLALGLPALVPNTPAGGMELLRRYAIPLAGRRAVVVGRSSVVGKPMALLLLGENATVTICHSHTVDLPARVREADVVVVGAGRARLITGAMLKAGATVIDFGINFPDDLAGKLTGDVDFASAVEVAGAISPVPGGAGPVTNMMLARNALDAARLLASRPSRRHEPD